MDRVLESAGRTLGSVALRYRRPMVRRPWPPAATWGGVPPYRWLAEADHEHGVPEGPTVRSPSVARLEAVLLLAREPLTSRKLADLASLADGTEARTLVRKLNRIYDLEGCAFHVVEVAGGFQLMSRPKFAPWLRRLHASPVEVRLSAPAVETLAVVAYRQPVLRAEIEAIRGVQCGEILRQLMERDLVRIGGRSEELGRPFLYGTTRHFLEVFGLRRLDELPRAELGRAAQPEHCRRQPASSIQSDPDREMSNQPTHSSKTQRESNVNQADDTMIVLKDAVGENAPILTEQHRREVSNEEDQNDEYDTDYDEELEDEDEELEDEDEELEDEDEELEDEDEDLEDEEWEEVEDDEEEEEDE